MSKLFLHWVNPLIMKGRRGKLTGTDEVFDLPVSCLNSFEYHQVGLYCNYYFLSQMDQHQKSEKNSGQPFVLPADFLAIKASSSL